MLPFQINYCHFVSVTTKPGPLICALSHLKLSRLAQAQAFSQNPVLNRLSYLLFSGKLSFSKRIAFVLICTTILNTHKRALGNYIASWWFKHVVSKIMKYLTAKNSDRVFTNLPIIMHLLLLAVVQAYTVWQICCIIYT